MSDPFGIEWSKKPLRMRLRPWPVYAALGLGGIGLGLYLVSSPPDMSNAPSVGVFTICLSFGNLCLAVPAGPMIALATALEATCTIWSPGGGERGLATTEFVLGPRHTILQPGENLRDVRIPAVSLARRTAFRRTSLSANGRSGALLIGTRDADGAFALTRTMVVMVLVTIGLAVFMMATTRRLSVVPGRGQFRLESMYGLVRNSIARDIIGSAHFKPYIPLLFTLFTLILVNNLMGIIPPVQFPTMSRIGIFSLF